MDKEKYVDIYGNGTLENENGNVDQISFGWIIHISVK